MNKYIIETKNLTKKYGSQKSVADLNIHVQKGNNLVDLTDTIDYILERRGYGRTWN